MLINDICDAVVHVIKNSDCRILRIEVDAKGRKKKVRVIAERKSCENGWSALQKCAPYIVILTFGCITLWNFLKMPGCRPTRIATYVENQACIVTNSFGDEITLIQDAKGCVTNKWE